MINEALEYAETYYEVIDGRKIFMAPSATSMHSGIIVSLSAFIFHDAFVRTGAHVFTDNVDVHFPDGSWLKPDLTVVKKENAGIIDWHGSIHGVPDFVVEVISKSTRKRDLTVKKDIYERNGVGEYWIVYPGDETIESYVLRNGKFELAGEYVRYNADEYARLTEAEKADVKHEIPVATFPDLKIKLENIFRWGYE